MPNIRDIVLGPWRAVLVLGVTQILTGGTLFYPPVLTVPMIARQHGWSFAFAMGGLSLGLLGAGLAALRYTTQLVGARWGAVQTDLLAKQP